MWKYERKTVDEKAEENHSGSCGDQHSIVPLQEITFLEQSKKERMFIEHMLDKHAFGYDNKTLAGSEDIETFFAKTIVKWIIFI